MEIVNFPTIKIGDTFIVDGEKFKKHSELVYIDAYGFEHYIDPLFDVKLGKEFTEQAALAPPATDTSAKIVKDTEEL